MTQNAKANGGERKTAAKPGAAVGESTEHHETSVVSVLQSNATYYLRPLAQAPGLEIRRLSAAGPPFRRGRIWA